MGDPSAVKKSSYWDIFVDPEIPAWQRAVNGALLPVVLIGAVAGCAAEDPSIPDPDSCDSDAANETHVTFKDGYVSEERKESIQNALAEDEGALRSLAPKLFCHFNGWNVTDDLGGNTAVYNYSSRRVDLPKDLSARSHEFCHYVSHRYSFVHGDRASETEQWRELSCFLNDHQNGRLENCVDHDSNIERGAEEEFANVCSPVFVNPLGALITYSTEENTMQQIRYVMEVMGIDDEWIREETDKLLQPVQSLEIQGQSEFSRLTIPYVIPDHARFLALGEETFGVQMNDRTIRLFKPSNADGWDHTDIEIPDSLDTTMFYFMSISNGTLIAKQHNQVYSLSVPEGENFISKEHWELLPADERLDGPGSLTFLNEEPTYLKWDEYMIADADGDFGSRSYPDSIQEELNNADYFETVYAESQVYMWISGITHPTGKVSRLYQMERDANGIAFHRTLEIPTTSGEVLPHYYKGSWYLIERVTNSEFTNEVSQLTREYFSLKPPVLLKIEDGGAKITPLKISYPNDNPLGLFYNLAGVPKYDWIVSGGRIVGLTRAHTRDNGEHVDGVPNFVSFEFNP